MNLIRSECPYDASTEQLNRLREALTPPLVKGLPEIPIIFDNDSFRAIVRDPRYAEASSLPPELEDSFDDIYENYYKGLLKVILPNDERVVPSSYTSHKFANTGYDSARRLFSNVNKVHPDGVERFDPDKILYNGHQVAWRLFECIVEVFGDTLDPNHSNIDWVKVALEMGRPFEVDPNFARHLCLYHYEWVAPIVSLWLWELRLVRARLRLLKRSLPQMSDYRESPTGVQLDQFKWSMCALSKELQIPGFQFDQISQLDAEDLVRKIASTKQLRAIARLIPSHLALLAMNIVQWVLNQDRGATVTPERPKVIKLLQDLAIESGQFLDGMIFPGDFKPDGSEMSRGGEASIMFGHIGQESVAIRVPEKHLGKKGASSWVKEKIYKRVVILHQQIEHQNLVKMLGLYSHGGKISVVMPRMSHSVFDHILPQGSMRGSYARLTAGVTSGLSYLHGHDMVHGDLHWHNVLIDKEGNPQITDLGMSRVLHPEGNSTSTEPYSSAFKIFMPFEIQDDHQKASEKKIPLSIKPERSIDIYSCGILFLALALQNRSRTVGRSQGRVEDIASKLAKGIYCEQPKELGQNLVPCGQTIWKLIERMTSCIADCRPSVERISDDLHCLDRYPTS